MKKIVFSISFVFLLFVMCSMARGSVLGDGYSIIGGESVEEQPVQETIQPPPQQPIQPPQQPVPVAEETTAPVPKKTETVKIEKLYERKKPPVPKKKDSISANNSKELNNTDTKKEEKHEDENIEKKEVLVIALPGDPIIEEDPFFDTKPLFRVFKIIITIIGCYFGVIGGFALIFMPKFYVYIDERYRFAGFLYLQNRGDRYYIRIPRRILKYGALKGKIVFKHSRMGEILEVDINKEIVSYPFEKEVMIYIAGEE